MHMLLVLLRLVDSELLESIGMRGRTRAPGRNPSTEPWGSAALYEQS